MINTYQDAVKLATRRGLRLAEYGDGADYSTAEAYAYWNKSGNRIDAPEIYIEYDFDLPDNRAGTVHFADVQEGRKYIITSPYESERSNPVIVTALSAAEAVKKSGLKLYRQDRHHGRGKPSYTVRVFTGWKESPAGKYFEPPQNTRPIYFYEDR